MDDLEFAKAFESLYEEAMKGEKNEDYTADPEQMRKYLKVCAFFSAAAADNHGTVPQMHMEPKEVHASVDCTFHSLWLHDDLLTRFQEILGYVSGFFVEEMKDGVEVSAVVPIVYVRNDEKFAKTH